MKKLIILFVALMVMIPGVVAEWGNVTDPNNTDIPEGGCAYFICHVSELPPTPEGKIKIPEADAILTMICVDSRWLWSYTVEEAEEAVNASGGVVNCEFVWFEPDCTCGPEMPKNTRCKAVEITTPQGDESDAEVVWETHCVMDKDEHGQLCEIYEDGTDSCDFGTLDKPVGRCFTIGKSFGCGFSDQYKGNAMPCEKPKDCEVPRNICIKISKSGIGGGYCDTEDKFYTTPDECTPSGGGLDPACTRNGWMCESIPPFRCKLGSVFIHTTDNCKESENPVDTSKPNIECHDPNPDNKLPPTTEPPQDAELEGPGSISPGSAISVFGIESGTLSTASIVIAVIGIVVLALAMLMKRKK